MATTSQTKIKTDQEGATIRNDDADKNNEYEDMEWPEEVKENWYDCSPVDQDEIQTEASDLETKERENTKPYGYG